MKSESECIITSNRGFFKYKLTRTGFAEFGSYCVYQYNIDRTNIALALSERNGRCRNFRVDVWYVRDDGNQSTKFDTSLATNGHLSIGCRDFNKATTRLLKKWCGL